MFTGMNYVLEVYKEMSFSKAAKNLYVSQPALSATIKRIETRLGNQIFDRSNTPITLTECGESYIAAAKQIQVIENNFTNYLNDLQQLQTGHLSIGGSNLFSSYVLPPLVAEFKKRFPLIEIDLIEENTSNLEQLLLTGALDIIIDNYVFRDTIFTKHLYHPEHLLLAVPRSFSINTNLEKYQLKLGDILDNHYLEETIAPVPLQLFQEEPFIFLKAENDTRQRGMRLCQNHGFTPHILLTLDQQVTAFNITCSGMGISFISDTLVQHVQPHSNVIYYKVDGRERNRNIYFYQKRGKYTTHAMAQFFQIVEEERRKHC